jgi:hypothetical protein
VQTRKRLVQSRKQLVQTTQAPARRQPSAPLPPGVSSRAFFCVTFLIFFCLLAICLLHIGYLPIAYCLLGAWERHRDPTSEYKEAPQPPPLLLHVKPRRAREHARQSARDTPVAKPGTLPPASPQQVPHGNNARSPAPTTSRLLLHPPCLHPLRCVICPWTAACHQLHVGTTTGPVEPATQIIFPLLLEVNEALLF